MAERHPLGTNLEGEALVQALIQALVAIQGEAVGTAADNRATQIGDALTVATPQEPTHKAEVAQASDGTTTLTLVAV